MIGSIDAMLCQWGRWAVAQARREVGYSPICPMFKDSSRGGGYGSGVPVGVEFGDIPACDRAVNRLPVVLRCVVIQHYQIQSSLRDTAKACGISHKSASQYLGMAHKSIAECLDAETVGG